MIMIRYKGLVDGYFREVLDYGTWQYWFAIVFFMLFLIDFVLEFHGLGYYSERH